jgi:CDP-diglyceride synthetase
LLVIRSVASRECPDGVDHETGADSESAQAVVSVIDSESSAVELTKSRRFVVLASRLPGAVVAVVSGIAISVFVLMGILQRTAFPEWSAANLDSEVSVATWYSAALLGAAAFWWFLVGVADRPRSLAVWMWWPVLAWLALDERTAIHERLERLSGIDWQLLYLPVMGLAAVAWWGVVRRYRSQTRVVALFVVGAAVWIAVMLLELVQNWGGSPVQAAIYVPTMITEEALEMVGSTVFLIAAILALDRSVQALPEKPTQTSL